MKVAVLGATGGTGRAVIRHLLAAGHQVSALARDSGRLQTVPGLTVLEGDAMLPADVARTVAGQDAAVVSLGNSQSPFAKLLGAKRTTPANICEVGTRNVIAAMQASSMRRLVCVTAFGVGDNRARMPLAFRLFYAVLLREHMADKERQETAVKASGLDWTLVQPVGLTDQPGAGSVLSSSSGEIGTSQISRDDVARIIVEELDGNPHLRTTLAVSGHRVTRKASDRS